MTPVKTEVRIKKGDRVCPTLEAGGECLAGRIGTVESVSKDSILVSFRGLPARCKHLKKSAFVAKHLMVQTEFL